MSLITRPAISTAARPTNAPEGPDFQSITRSCRQSCWGAAVTAWASGIVPLAGKQHLDLGDRDVRQQRFGGGHAVEQRGGLG